VENVDKNLKSILNSVTYLEWPGFENSRKVERFWKKLELSLPKKSSPSPLQTVTSSESDSKHDSSTQSVPQNSIDISNSDSSKSSVHLPTDSLQSVQQLPSLHSLTQTAAIGESPKYSKHKKKDFKHFMDKLVRHKAFSRQDSNSSQAALVDAETLASRSSCGSVSESIVTESSEPSTPSSSPEMSRSRRVGSTESVDTDDNFTHRVYVNTAGVSKHCKENLAFECEKDHSDSTECLTCHRGGLRADHADSESSSQEFLNLSYDYGESSDDLSSRECEYCSYANTCSDNNRVKISSVPGSNQLKIQRIPPHFPHHLYCNRFPERHKYRGSIKHHKDRANEIMRQKRVGSLPRNYKNSGVLNAVTDHSSIVHRANSSQNYFSREGLIDVCEHV